MRSFSVATERCVLPTTQSSNSASSRRRGSLPGNGTFVTEIGASAERSITPYSPPCRSIVFPKVAFIPVRRASSAGRAANRGLAAAMTAAVRGTSSFLSEPTQWRTLKLMIVISRGRVDAQPLTIIPQARIASAVRTTFSFFIFWPFVCSMCFVATIINAHRRCRTAA